MKNKLERFFYLLTLWVGVSTMILLLCLFLTNTINRKHKPEKIQLYTIYALPSYDSMGNVTIARKIIDHEPTRQDSIEIGFIFK